MKFKKQKVKCMTCNGTGQIILEDINMFFGYHLKQLRNDRCITQSELANKMGISRTALTNIEAGRQRISLNQLHAIASALNISIKDLF